MSTSLSPESFKSNLDSGKFIVIDVRTKEEYENKHLNGSLNLDYYQPETWQAYFKKANKDDNYLVYCRSGARSGQVVRAAKDLGFKNIFDLAGGLNNWRF